MMNHNENHILNSAQINKSFKNIEQKSDVIAHQWQSEVMRFSGLEFEEPGSHLKYRELTDQVLSLLFDNNSDESGAQEIGVGLARLHPVHPNVIEATGKLWGNQLMNIDNINTLQELYQRLINILTSMAVGYFLKSPETLHMRNENINSEISSKSRYSIKELEENKLYHEANIRELLHSYQVSEDRFQQIIENALDGIFQVDTSGLIVFCNNSFAEILGYTKDELVGRSFRTVMDVGDLPKVSPLVQQLKEGIPINDEFRLRHKNGNLIDVSTRVVSHDEDGKILITGFITDITDRKQAEEELRASEEINRAILNASNASISMIDAAGTFMALNEKTAKRFGKRVKELLGTCVYDYFPPDVASARKAVIDKVFHTAKGIILEETSKGSYFEHRIDPILDPQGNVFWVVIFVNDITDRKQSEEVLRTNEATVRAIFNATDASIYMHDRAGTIIALNRMAAMRLGMTEYELIGKCVYDQIPPDVGKTRKLVVDQVFNSGVGRVFEDIREGIDYENRIAPVLDPQGGVTRVVIYANDITSRKQAEIALIESESRYRTLAEAAQDMIFIVNSDDCIEYINHFSAGKLGKRPEEIIGKSRSLIFSKKASDEQLKVIKKVFRTGETNYSEEMMGFQEGKSWWSVWLIPIKDVKGAVTKVMGVARDITSLKQTQNTLEQTNETLEKRVSERTAELVKSQNQLSALTRQIITSQEDERRRLARALHDEAGQALITIKYDLASIVEEFFFDYQQLHQHISRSMQTIDQAMAHIRRLAENLRPPVLDVAGINISLKEHCWDISTRTSLSIDYRGVELPELPEEISICLYRFVQEALTNVLRHAKASSVKVTLSYRKNMITLTVLDDGQGMNTTYYLEGIGLQGMRERLNLLGGRLVLQSSPGNGVRVSARVPWVGSMKKSIV